MDSAGSRRPKVGHKKSRKGCVKCKTRRVKVCPGLLLPRRYSTDIPALYCDERSPVCSNCERLGLPCQWPARAARPTPSPTPTNVPSNGVSSHDESHAESIARAFEWLKPTSNDVFLSAFDDTLDVELGESKQRRMQEHMLMQNYIFTMGRPFVITPSEDWIELFSRKIPELSLRYDNLFYSLLTLSATHMLQKEPEDAELFKARQTYLIAAVRAQREMVGRLNPQLADPVCLTSVLLLIHSFAALGERSLQPYVSPVEWLQMGKGVGEVMWLSIQAMPKDIQPEPLFMKIAANSYPRFEDETYFDPSMRKDFDGVLTQAIPCADDWSDTDLREAYEKTLSYVGSIQLALARGEPTYAVCRRIQTFAVLMPKKFIELVAEHRPRALVILAHFFATVAQVDGVWWLGCDGGAREKTSTREIRAISQILPEEWQGLMIWPRDKAGIR